MSNPLEVGDLYAEKLTAGGRWKPLVEDAEDGAEVDSWDDVCAWMRPAFSKSARRHDCEQ